MLPETLKKINLVTCPLGLSVPSTPCSDDWVVPNHANMKIYICFTSPEIPLKGRTFHCVSRLLLGIEEICFWVRDYLSLLELKHYTTLDNYTVITHPKQARLAIVYLFISCHVAL